MITKEKIGNELYVWFWERGLKQLIYKRWLDKGYGKVMDRQPFTAKDTESFNQSFTDKKTNMIQFEAIEEQSLTDVVALENRAQLIYDLFIECRKEYPNAAFSLSGNKPYTKIFIKGNKTVGSDYDLTTWKEVPIFHLESRMYSPSAGDLAGRQFLDLRLPFAGYHGSEDWRKDSDSLRRQMLESLRRAVYDFTETEENTI